MATLGLPLLTGCISSWASAEPLPYEKLIYSSVDGKAWPEKNVVLTVPEGTTTGRKLRISYVELNPEGERTVVFLHGLGSYLKFWRYQLDAFAAKGYRVIALDMVGYGKSDKPSTFSYTTEAMAEVVRAFLRTTGVRQPVLVGHSMGGQIAMSFAIRYPDDLRALALASPAGFEHFSPREKRWMEKVFTVALVEGATPYDLWGNIRYSNFSRWTSDYEWLVEERARTAKDPAFDSYAYAQVKSVRGLMNDDFVRTSLDKIRAPTLIVFGDEDRLIPNPFLHGGTTRSIMEYGQEHIEGARLVELDGCGHTVQMDCSAEFNAALLPFLEQLPAPAPAPADPENKPPEVAKPAETPTSDEAPAPAGDEE